MSSTISEEERFYSVMESGTNVNSHEEAAKAAKPIGVFDSGVGGLPYLARIRELLPDENYVYMADRANFPYGEKDDDLLRELVVEAVGRLIDRCDPKLMVIACNTASVVALDELRRRYQVPFVGVVPAIKPAAEISRRRAIGVLATRRTVEDPYTDSLIREYAESCSVARYAGVDIVEFVEKHYPKVDLQRQEEVLQPAVDYFRARGVDTLVVACTHFIYVEEALSGMLGAATQVIDSRDGVARQVRRILEKHGRKGKFTDQSRREDLFFTSRDEEQSRYRNFAEMYRLKWGGEP